MSAIGDILRIDAIHTKKEINYVVKEYYSTSLPSEKQYELLLLKEQISNAIKGFYTEATKKAKINDADFNAYVKTKAQNLQENLISDISSYSSKNYSLNGILNWINRVFDKEIESFIPKIQDKVKEQEVQSDLYLAQLKGYKRYLFRTASTDACKKCQELNGSILPIGNAEIGINLPPMHPHCKCDIITGSDSVLEEERQTVIKEISPSETKDKEILKTFPNRKAFINMLKETLPAADLFFFYNPTETYISKDEIRKDLQKAPDYVEELYERYADKLIVEQMFEGAPLSDAAVRKIDFLLNYDMYKILPDIEDRLAIYDILESYGEMSKVNFQHYEDKLNNKDKAWIIATYNTTQLGTTVGDIFTGFILEGLTGVTSYFTAKNSGSLNSLQKVDAADKYFKEEFLQGSKYASEIKEFYVNNSKALDLSNEAELLNKTSKSTEGSGPGIRGSNSTVNGFDTTVNAGKQGKHIVGNNNYIEGRSIFKGTADDAQRLVDKFAGTGDWIGANKERINFGEVIGRYMNPATGEAVDTTVGIIHYSKTGTHIVPAQPIQ